MNAAELLHQLGHELGIDVHISEQGVCRIYFDDDAIDFEQTEGGLCLIAEAGALPPQGGETLCRELLAANLFGIETAGATLGLDPAPGTLFLHKMLPNTMEYQDFEAELERFAKVLRHWKDRLLARSLQGIGEESLPAFGLKV